MTSLETAKHIQEDTPNSHMCFSGELNSKWQSKLTRYKKIIFYEQISQLKYFGYVTWFIDGLSVHASVCVCLLSSVQTGPDSISQNE